MLAVIKTGGKQYIVAPGQKIEIEKLDKKEGSEITFNEVLLLEKSNHLEIGSPLVAGAKVLGKVLGHGKGDKVIAFKYKAKKRTAVKKGHRQLFTEVEITSLEMK
ncbi:MAG: 50S ribosomal protein L21 [Candidatus Nealsonbacteria bacterium]|nr:50S ribosomal protein L21 [Candidatus Nealsonbacteria bacterium]